MSERNSTLMALELRAPTIPLPLRKANDVTPTLNNPLQAALKLAHLPPIWVNTRIAGSLES